MEWCGNLILAHHGMTDIQGANHNIFPAPTMVVKEMNKGLSTRVNKEGVGLMSCQCWRDAPCQPIEMHNTIGATANNGKISLGNHTQKCVYTGLVGAHGNRTHPVCVHRETTLTSVWHRLH